VRLENRVAAGLDLRFAGRDERQQKVVEGILRAVIGVQGNGDRVVLGNLGRERREGECAGCAGLDALAGEVVCTTGGDLNNAVRAGFAQPWRIPLMVDEEDALIAGYANPPFFALSSMSAYCSGVATGIESP